MQIYWKKIRKMKQLLKILIGAAWIDGVIQPEERKYLRRIATDFQLAEDPEIKPLLAELKPIQPEECYEWLEEYLGINPTQADYQELLEKISGLIYSDGDVDVREVKLIEKLQLLDPTNQPRKSVFDKVLKKIQKLYQQAIHEQA
jgi:uncharacterized membrane protein YebE (DUF533 family)